MTETTPSSHLDDNHNGSQNDSHKDHYSESSEKQQNIDSQHNHDTETATSTHHTSEDYEQEMLLAFVQKPSKVSYYQKALNKMMVTGSPNLQWHWSWWGFFGGWIFMLYRKAYLAAFVTFLVTSAISFIPFGAFATMIVLGGIAPYFIVKRYAMLKQQIENRYDTQAERLEAMTEVGGFHPWVAWAAVIFYVLVFITVFLVTLFDPSSIHH